MSLFIVQGLIVQNNPAPVNSPFVIDVRFKCLKKLQGIFDWKVIYVGSADDPSYDQTIQSFDMSNLEAGDMQIQIQAPPPDFSKIPQEQIVGNTAVVISISYESQQFFRVGYYIRNQYQNQEMNQNPPQQPIVNQLNRFILAQNPRVSNFEIEWIKKQGKVQEDIMCVEKNIQIMGGDPFLQSNGALQMLENVNINGYGMFPQNNQ